MAFPVMQHKAQIPLAKAFICSIRIGNDFSCVSFLALLQFFGFVTDLTASIGLSSFDQQHPEVTIASFRDFQPVLIVTVRILARNQSQI